MITSITSLKEIKDNNKKVTITGRLNKFKQIKKNNTFLNKSSILYVDSEGNRWYPEFYIDDFIRNFKSKFNIDLQSGDIVKISGKIIFDFGRDNENNIILNDKNEPKYLNVNLRYITDFNVIKQRKLETKIDFINDDSFEFDENHVLWTDTDCMTWIEDEGQ